MSTPDINSSIVDESDRKFKVVFVPADPSQPVEECSVHQKAGDAISCLTAYCRDHFARQSLKDSQKDVFKSQVRQQSKDQNISDQMLDMMSKMTTCDLVVLHPNKRETGFISINMYVDDKGVAKQLPVNHRAVSICQAAGIQLQVMGDAFIGKQFDNEEGFHRIDFTTSDLDTSLPWFKVAQAYNANQLRNTPANAQQLLAQTVHENDEEDAVCEAAKDAKDRGNGFFKQGELESAIGCYTEGLDAMQPQGASEKKIRQYMRAASAHLTLSNRAACYNKLGKFDLALKDADKGIDLRPKWPKSYGRKADALFGMQKFGEAKQVIVKALELAPESPDFQARLKEIEAKLEA